MVSRRAIFYRSTCGMHLIYLFSPLQNGYSKLRWMGVIFYLMHQLFRSQKIFAKISDIIYHRSTVGPLRRNCARINEILLSEGEFSTLYYLDDTAYKLILKYLEITVDAAVCNVYPFFRQIISSQIKCCT